MALSFSVKPSSALCANSQALACALDNQLKCLAISQNVIPLPAVVLVSDKQYMPTFFQILIIHRSIIAIRGRYEDIDAKNRKLLWN